MSTRTRKLSNKRHHNIYVAKYAAKPPSFSSLDYVSYLNIDGRHWGVHFPELIPKFDTLTYDGLSEAQVQRLQALGRETFEWYGEYAELGFSMFGRLGARMVEAVREICLDNEAPPC